MTSQEKHPLPSDRNERRRFFRRIAANAEVTIDYRIYDVIDWSLGGIAFETAPQDIDSSPQTYSEVPWQSFQCGDVVEMKVKFYFQQKAAVIQQPARILRRTGTSTVAVFAALSPEARRGFQRVIDAAQAEEFLTSQAPHK